MDYYIGIDAHSSTCTFVALNSMGKEVYKNRVPTSEKEIRSTIQLFKGKVAVALEESTIAKWVHAITVDICEKVIVCHPGYLSPSPGSKTDYRDSFKLATELMANRLIPVYHDADNPYIKIRSMVSGYQDVNAEIVRTKNRFKSIFRSEGIKKSGTKVYSDPTQLTDLKNDYHQFQADALMFQIQTLHEVKARYIEAFKENAHQYEIIKQLKTIPEVSDVRANIIAAYTCDGRRFSNKHKYWSYAGLVRYRKISDDRCYGSEKIHGRNELKTAFIGMAEGILLHENPLRSHYDRLRSKGKDHKAARKSLARKLAAITLAIFKKNTNYSERKAIEDIKR